MPRHHTNRRPNRRPRPLRIKFISYSENLGRPSLRIPSLLTVDCTRLPTPSPRLQERYTGLDRTLSDALFTCDLFKGAYHNALGRIYRAVNLWIQEDDYEEGEEVAVLVKCMAGMHRSVVMAEGLADEVDTWQGVQVRVKHVDMREAVGAMEEKGHGPYIRWWRRG